MIRHGTPRQPVLCNINISASNVSIKHTCHVICECYRDARVHEHEHSLPASLTSSSLASFRRQLKTDGTGRLKLSWFRQVSDDDSCQLIQTERDRQSATVQHASKSVKYHASAPTVSIITVSSQFSWGWWWCGSNDVIIIIIISSSSSRDSLAF